MPALYNFQTEELFHLSDIWIQKSTLTTDIVNALAEVAVADSRNIRIWTDLFTQVSAFTDTFGGQNPHAVDANAEVLAARKSTLESAEVSFKEFIDGAETHNYFQAQLYNYLAAGYEYAGDPAKSHFYKDLLAKQLLKSSIDGFVIKVDELNQQVANLRSEHGKPRDSITDEAKYAFLQAEITCRELFSELLTMAENPACNPQSLSLAFSKLGRSFRKIDCLDEASACLREAYRLQPESNVRLNNLAIVLQKKGTPDCLDEAAGLLKSQLDKDLATNAKRFVTPYYLKYVLCQRAHHYIVNAQVDLAIACLDSAKQAAGCAEAAIQAYADNNYALKAKLRLELIKLYHNQLIKAVNLMVPTANIEQVTLDWDAANSLDKSGISESRQQTLQAKHSFFAGLDVTQVQAKVVDFTNNTRVC